MHAVIVTGGRTYPYAHVVQTQLRIAYVKYGLFFLFHGACTRRGSTELTGADRWADEWGRNVYGMRVESRPANWDLGLRGGPVRNRQMVREAVELVGTPENVHGLAFPEPRSKGTWNCIKEMENVGIKDIDVWDTVRAREWLNIP